MSTIEPIANPPSDEDETESSSGSASPVYLAMFLIAGIIIIFFTCIWMGITARQQHEESTKKLLETEHKLVMSASPSPRTPQPNETETNFDYSDKTQNTKAKRKKSRETYRNTNIDEEQQYMNDKVNMDENDEEKQMQLVVTTVNDDDGKKGKYNKLVVVDEDENKYENVVEDDDKKLDEVVAEVQQYGNHSKNNTEDTVNIINTPTLTIPKSPTLTVKDNNEEVSQTQEDSFRL